MKFLIDAQLPYRLKNWIVANGHDAIHTNDLPDKNLTTDTEIISVADAEDRIVITKDSDFLKSKVLHDKPQKLFLVTTGNIANKDLLILFENHFATAVKFFDSHDVVKMNNVFVSAHHI